MTVNLLSEFVHTQDTLLWVNLSTYLSRLVSTIKYYKYFLIII